MVTFTDAAAAEMRQRIRARLTEQLALSPDAKVVSHLEEQVALLDTANISTLHSFCLRLVREHFHHERLQLDPEFIILTEDQIFQLRQRTLDELLESHYGGESADARAFQRLVTEQARGAEALVRDLIWRLHRYTQSLADPAGWFERQLGAFAEPQPDQWRAWMLEGCCHWRDEWLPVLREQPEENIAAARCAKSLAEFVPGEVKSALGEILATDADKNSWPKGKKTVFREPIKKFFAEAEFLHSLTPAADGANPLAQDWEWSRGHMQTLLRLAREFAAQFSQAKLDLGGVDFADLEQFALRLLWDAQAGQPTAIAMQWRARLKFVFVDEYQDINEAQDTILRAVSREGAASNRFLVGDVKQSIYRFRLADPTIFQAYKKSWEKLASDLGRTIPLSDNFRSRAALLDFVNPLFASLMRGEIGGVDYDADAHLQFGAPEERVALSRDTDPNPQVELHIQVKGGDDEKADSDADPSERAARAELADLEATEKEARMVAWRLRALHAEKFPVWDEKKKKFRAVDWGDMVVLLRAPSSKVEGFAKEFSRAGVPFHAARGGFYDTTEVSDLLSLLQLLDNPLQDIPLLAVLRSPLVGLSLDELAFIRAEKRDGKFWEALEKNQKSEIRNQKSETQRKVGAFLDSFQVWRKLARQGALSDCLEAVLAETHYEWLVEAQPRGEARRANVNRLLNLIRKFDPYQRQGLFRFLKFVETQRDASAEEKPAPPGSADAVRLMSIHQSKGLEFPVVVIADLGKTFNLGDLRADILLDQKYGLCPRVVPPERNGHYPSLPYWLARRRQLGEALGEELRLLYVALTRAKDRLILTGTTGKKNFIETWRDGVESGTIVTRDILSSRNYLAWLQLWLPRVTNTSEWAGDSAGENHLLTWALYSENDARLLAAGEKSSGAESKPETAKPEPPVVADAVVERLLWEYPFTPATERAAKTSVTALRRQAAEMDEEAEQLFTVERDRSPVAAHGRSPRLGKFLTSSTSGRAAGGDRPRSEFSAAERGIAHHKFLQHVSLAEAGEAAKLKQEVGRLQRDGVLTAAEAGALDLKALAGFWSSKLGRRIRAHPGSVRRELPFTARFAPAELDEVTKRLAGVYSEDEFVVVQGVVDLAVIQKDEIWLLDFKTDAVSSGELEAKKSEYAPQLKLYAQALARIYPKQPVTECWLHFLAAGQSVAIQV